MNGNYGWGLPIQASTYAPKIDFGIYLIHAAMISIFVLWSIFFTYLLVKYRRREGVPAHGGHHDKETFLGLLPDLAVMAFELGLIAFYAIPVWSNIKMTFPKEEGSNVVRVVAEQFAWGVHYPGPDGKFGRVDAGLIHFSNPLGLDPQDPAAKDDVIGSNEIHMPVDKPTLIELTSKDVIHSFFIPEFRIKQDAVPGMKIPVWVEPTKVGHYELGCAQLCGIGHSHMRADVYVESEADFKAWLAAQSAKPGEKKPQPVEQW